MTFNSRELHNRLRALSAGREPARWIVAYSGGIDSTVLLHALARSITGVQVLAVHIDHGLHPESAGWATHCQKFASDLGVGFLMQSVSVPEKSENGPEAAARTARYNAFLPLVQSNDYLLSAHHEDDQAETLLLNLMRGSGPAGLAGIGRQQSFGRGHLLRPMLGVPGEEIAAYAHQHGLQWIEDPSNADSRFDRNFLRRQILPDLAARWPAVSNRLRRSAELVGEASELLNDLADIDLDALGAPNKLSISGLLKFSSERQRNVIRRAVRLCGLPSPPATRLYQIIHELLRARADAQPLVIWPGACARRYRDHLFVLPYQPDAARDTPGSLWPDGSALPLGHGFGSLKLSRHSGAGLDPGLAQSGVVVRYRQGGETIRVAGQGGTRTLKNLLQEEGIVPWMRAELPLLYAGERLLAVADLWLAADCMASPGLQVMWIDRPALK